MDLQRGRSRWQLPTEPGVWIAAREDGLAILELELLSQTGLIMLGVDLAQALVLLVFEENRQENIV